mgnify:FL=1
MFRKVKLVSAFGLNYDWARDTILSEYMKYIESDNNKDKEL